VNSAGVKLGYCWKSLGKNFHRPGNPATVGVVRWPAAGDTAGSSLHRLSSLQHRIYNLLGVLSQAMDYARKLRDDRGRGNIVVVDDGDETMDQMGDHEFQVWIRACCSDYLLTDFCTCATV